MPRESKDIARRLRFDPRPRRDGFRRFYFAVGLLACLAAVGLWLGLRWQDGERQYLPGPVSPAHATFGDRCASCHEAFAAAPDARCETCHRPGAHAAGGLPAPACRACHAEHRGAARLLAGTDQPCRTCHGDLQAAHTPAIATSIVDFTGHPEFRPLRAGQRDPARLRFNHALHLTSTNVREPLVCAHCHVVEADGGLMAPIEFETHCRRCHDLHVKEAPAPIGDIETPHVAPAEVRRALRDALAALAVSRPAQLFAGSDPAVLIPGQAQRGPIDESRSLQQFQQKWVTTLEAQLYQPFTDAAPLLENNKYCFLCHLAGETPGGDGLPSVAATDVPRRWLAYAHFSHAKHEKMDCADCHGSLRDSADTGTVNLPAIAVCQQCHADDRVQSAGTDCTACHVYHAAPATPVGPGTPAPTATAVPTVGLETLLGR